MICNYLIINYMYNKNHIPILYTDMCKYLIFSIIK